MRCASNATENGTLSLSLMYLNVEMPFLNPWKSTYGLCDFMATIFSFAILWWSCMKWVCSFSTIYWDSHVLLDFQTISTFFLVTLCRWVSWSHQPVMHFWPVMSYYITNDEGIQGNEKIGPPLCNSNAEVYRSFLSRVPVCLIEYISWFSFMWDFKHYCLYSIVVAPKI